MMKTLGTALRASNTVSKFATLSVVILISGAVHAATQGPLFKNGAETFQLQDQSGKTPEFRVLDGNASEKALALGVIAALNAQAEVDPKIPVQDHVDLKVQSLTFEPLSKKSKELSMTMKLSGYNVEFTQTVNRAKFESGAPIEIKFPQKEKQFAMFNIESSGNVKMRFDPKTQVLMLNDVRAKLDYDSTLGDSGTEAIQFSGKGLRQ
jgi:hypothetical protein